MIVPGAFQMRECPRPFADAFACEKYVAFVGDGHSLATRLGEESQVGTPERVHAVRKEIRARTLVSALPPEIDRLEATMEIRAYRERPSVPAKAGTRPGKTDAPSPRAKGSVEALWAYLVGTQPAA